MVKRSRSAEWSLVLLLCSILCALLSTAEPPRAESSAAMSKAEREKQALFLEAREANRVEARRLSARGGAKRTKRTESPDSPNRPLFGGFFKKKDAKNSPAENESTPAVAAIAKTPATTAQAAPAPPARNIAASRPSSPVLSTKITPVAARSVPKIAAAPAAPAASTPSTTAPPPAPPPAPRPSPATNTPTAAAAAETTLLLPDVQVQPSAPTSEPSYGEYGDIKIIAESRAELQKGALVYEGSALMKAPAFRIESNRISVGFSSAGDEIQEARAVGSVSVRVNSQGNRPPISAQSARAHFDPGQGSITLSGWPEYSIGDERRIATTPDTVIVLFLDGRIETEGETRLSLVQ